MGKSIDDIIDDFLLTGGNPSISDFELVRDISKEKRRKIMKDLNLKTTSQFLKKEEEDDFESIEELTSAEIKSIMEAQKKGAQIIAEQYSLENYQIQKELGKGSFGTVFLAEDKSTGKQVALKEIRKPGNLSDDREFQTYEHLQKAAARDLNTIANSKTKPLCHPNIVCIDKVFVQDGKVYIVMEYVKGFIDGKPSSDLFDFIDFFRDQDRKPSIPQIAKIIYEIAKGTLFLHESGIFHRDLKPENILISDEKEVKVTDYGLSCFTDLMKDCVRATSGTPIYISPQVFNNLSLQQLWKRDDLNELKRIYRSNDVFAIGVIMFFLMFDTFPYKISVRDSLGEKMKKYESGYQNIKIKLFGKIDTKEKEKIYKILLGCIEIDYKKRFTIRELISDISDLF